VLGSRSRWAPGLRSSPRRWAGRLCVVHLIRATNSLESLRLFVDAYEAHPAAETHDLALVYKGFDQIDQLEPVREVVGSLPHIAIRIPDAGVDIAAYRAAALALDHDAVCFLNSFSEPLVEGWLARLAEHAFVPGVGLAGATGSWESTYACFMRTAYAFRSTGSLSARVRGRLRRSSERARYRLMFPGFPNPHIRTNAFLMPRQVFLDLTARVGLTKWQALGLESGRFSLTRQVWKAGQRTVVVGRDGVAYEPADWFDSHTFRSGGQRNLLVADRRTRDFAVADADARRELAWSAWGSVAQQEDRGARGNGPPP